MLIRIRLQYITAFSDEATFYNTSQPNRHNSHYWSVKNSHWHHQVNHLG